MPVFVWHDCKCFLDVERDLMEELDNVLQNNPTFLMAFKKLKKFAYTMWCHDLKQQVNPRRVYKEYLQQETRLQNSLLRKNTPETDKPLTSTDEPVTSLAEDLLMDLATLVIMQLEFEGLINIGQFEMLSPPILQFQKPFKVVVVGNDPLAYLLAMRLKYFGCEIHLVCVDEKVGTLQSVPSFHIGGIEVQLCPNIESCLTAQMILTQQPIPQSDPSSDNNCTLETRPSDSHKPWENVRLFDCKGHPVESTILRNCLDILASWHSQHLQSNDISGMERLLRLRQLFRTWWQDTVVSIERLQSERFHQLNTCEVHLKEACDTEKKVLAAKRRMLSSVAEELSLMESDEQVKEMNRLAKDMGKLNELLNDFTNERRFLTALTSLLTKVQQDLVSLTAAFSYLLSVCTFTAMGQLILGAPPTLGQPTAWRHFVDKLDSVTEQLQPSDKRTPYRQVQVRHSSSGCEVTAMPWTSTPTKLSSKSQVKICSDIVLCSVTPSTLVNTNKMVTFMPPLSQNALLDSYITHCAQTQGKPSALVLLGGEEVQIPHRELADNGFCFVTEETSVVFCQRVISTQSTCCILYVRALNWHHNDGEWSVDTLRSVCLPMVFNILTVTPPQTAVSVQIIAAEQDPLLSASIDVDALNRLTADELLSFPQNLCLTSPSSSSDAIPFTMMPEVFFVGLNYAGAVRDETGSLVQVDRALRTCHEVMARLLRTFTPLDTLQREITQRLLERHFVEADLWMSARVAARMLSSTGQKRHHHHHDHRHTCKRALMNGTLDSDSVSETDMMPTSPFSQEILADSAEVDDVGEEDEDVEEEDDEENVSMHKGECLSQQDLDEGRVSDDNESVHSACL